MNFAAIIRFFRQLVSGISEAMDSDPGKLETPSQAPKMAPTEPVTIPTAPSPSQSPAMPSVDNVTRFCTCIMNFEGGPNDPNHLNNNPGDFRCSPVGYLPKYGKVVCNVHGFAVFPTFALGWEYLIESVHYRALAHPTWTILDFFENFAPSSDGNDPLHYATVVAEEMGVGITTSLQELLG